MREEDHSIKFLNVILLFASYTVPSLLTHILYFLYNSVSSQCFISLSMVGVIYTNFFAFKKNC